MLFCKVHVHFSNSERLIANVFLLMCIFNSTRTFCENTHFLFHCACTICKSTHTLCISAHSLFVHKQAVIAEVNSVCIKVQTFFGKCGCNFLFLKPMECCPYDPLEKYVHIETLIL